MPLYEYRCSKCGKTFEVLQKFSDAPLKRHKECGGTVHRLVSASSFQLKGGGWYASGYSKGPPAKVGSTSDSGAGADSKTESKSESKSESKTETKSESKADSMPAKSESKPAKTKG